MAIRTYENDGNCVSIDRKRAEGVKEILSECVGRTCGETGKVKFGMMFFNETRTTHRREIECNNHDLPFLHGGKPSDFRQLPGLQDDAGWTVFR